MVLNVTDAIKEETDIKEVVRLTILEGQITVKLFISLLPSSFHEKERYHEMSNLLSRIARIGNVFDTAMDLPRDFADNQVKITPTIFHRAAFLGAALSEGVRMKKEGLFTLKTMRLFSDSLYKTMKDRKKEL